MKKLFVAIFGVVMWVSLARAEDRPPASIVLDPATLRVQLLQGNLSIDEAQKRVEDAKTRVGLARATLFPSINVSAIFSGNFVLSSIEFLVPFLVPANWITLHQNQNLFEAEKLSYKVLQLNTYSSALALYFNVKNDWEVTQQYIQQAQDLKEIATFIQKAVRLGIAAPEDEKNALGNAEAAEGHAAKMRMAMTKEIAALRQALGLSLETEIHFSEAAADNTVPASEVESGTTAGDIAKSVERSLSVAPENAQIDYLVRAAQNGTWSKAFGWINSATMSTPAVPAGSSASFAKMQAKGSISVGLGLYPTIELSNRNVEEIRQRFSELKQEQTQILEGGILAVREAQLEQDHFANAESNLKEAYGYTLKQYRLGIATLYDVLVAHKNLSSAAINRIQARLDLTLLRVTLHRTMLTDEFSLIKGCDLTPLPNSQSNPKKRGGLADWLGGLFGGGQDDSGVSLLELCRQRRTQ